MNPFAVLFVCMGNICRSPTAHGVFQRKVIDAGLVDRIKVDSAGTHNYHPGSPPDARSQVHAQKRGYDLSDLRARQITDTDFEDYGLILVMDWDNLALVQELCPNKHLGKVRRLTEFCLVHDAPVVPDPYYGGTQGFDHVLDLVEDACDDLLGHVKQKISAKCCMSMKSAGPFSIPLETAIQHGVCAHWRCPRGCHPLNAPVDKLLSV